MILPCIGGIGLELGTSNYNTRDGGFS